MVELQTKNVVSLDKRVMDNQAIVAGMQNGELSAADAMYDRFGQRINRIVWRLLGADSEHDDIVHEVFIEALKSLENLKNPDALGAWLGSIAVYCVRKEIRRRVRQKKLFTHQETEQLDHAHCFEGDSLLARRVYQIVDKMKVDDRIPFCLRYLDEYSLTEVADLCGCSLATIKRKLQRAKKLFRQRAVRDSVVNSWLEKVGIEN
jgi:RNA polymerase sigma-70 factor (ECF subfamily)